ncbi:MAG: exodeoxyribonuclease III [Alphaproteobacteria bacterium]|nr:exodeoxyribonuclease III [Alphaproteobacteria bacterium]
MKIATWNINGIKARLPNLLLWLKENMPDIVCLQEIKSVEEKFPYEPFEDLGYNVSVWGQKSFNGVAILSKKRIDEIICGLPGSAQNENEQARYLEAVISTDQGAIRVASIYLPNGNPVDSEKFTYKLDWMDRLYAHAQKLLKYEEFLVLGGDYNVIPEPHDIYNVEAVLDNALFQIESRTRYHSLLALGYSDAMRACHDGTDLYTFWDYKDGAWKKNNGMRIDHLLLSPQASDHLVSAEIDAKTRSWEKPSDHAPVIAVLDL